MDAKELRALDAGELSTKLGDLHAAVRRHLGLRRKLLSRLVDSAKFLSKTTQLLLNILPLHLLWDPRKQLDTNFK